MTRCTPSAPLIFSNSLKTIPGYLKVNSLMKAKLRTLGFFVWSCSEIYIPLCRARKHTHIRTLVCAQLWRKHASSLLLSSSPSRQLNTLTLLKQFLTLSTADWVKPGVLVACFNKKSGGLFSWTGMALWTPLSSGNWQTSLQVQASLCPTYLQPTGYTCKMANSALERGWGGEFGMLSGGKISSTSQHPNPMGWNLQHSSEAPSAFMGQGQ